MDVLSPPGAHQSDPGQELQARDFSVEIPSFEKLHHSAPSPVPDGAEHEAQGGGGFAFAIPGIKVDHAAVKQGHDDELPFSSDGGAFFRAEPRGECRDKLQDSRTGQGSG